MDIREARVKGCVGWGWSLHHLRALGIFMDLPGAGQTVTSQYSHFTFSLLTLTKHQGLWSPSGFLKHKIKVTDHQSLEAQIRGCPVPILHLNPPIG